MKRTRATPRPVLTIKERGFIDLFKKGKLSYHATIDEWGCGPAGTWLEASTGADLRKGDRCQFMDLNGVRFGAVADEVTETLDLGMGSWLVRLLTDGVPLPAVPDLTDEGREIALRMRRMLDDEGCRSDLSGLVGFRTDLYEYLEAERRCFTVVGPGPRARSHAMAIVHCRMAPGVGKDTAKSRMEELWLQALCYPDFEEHVFEDADDGFVFHFLTWEPPHLGVYGRVECRTE
jgi:hypothetical protein